ncbi:MAG: hypothetical protein AAFW46_16790 [Pseudomonadota bacterium]
MAEHARIDAALSETTRLAAACALDAAGVRATERLRVATDAPAAEMRIAYRLFLCAGDQERPQAVPFGTLAEILHALDPGDAAPWLVYVEAEAYLPADGGDGQN